jgi:hypothetical protein
MPQKTNKIIKKLKTKWITQILQIFLVSIFVICGLNINTNAIQSEIDLSGIKLAQTDLGNDVEGADPTRITKDTVPALKNLDVRNIDTGYNNPADDFYSQCIENVKSGIAECYNAIKFDRSLFGRDLLPSLGDKVVVTGTVVLKKNAQSGRYIIIGNKNCSAETYKDISNYVSAIKNSKEGKNKCEGYPLTKISSGDEYNFRERRNFSALPFVNNDFEELRCKEGIKYKNLVFRSCPVGFGILPDGFNTAIGNDIDHYISDSTTGAWIYKGTPDNQFSISKDFKALVDAGDEAKIEEFIKTNFKLSDNERQRISNDSPLEFDILGQDGAGATKEEVDALERAKKVREVVQSNKAIKCENPLLDRTDGNYVLACKSTIDGKEVIVSPTGTALATDCSAFKIIDTEAAKVTNISILRPEELSPLTSSDSACIKKDAFATILADPKNTDLKNTTSTTDQNVVANSGGGPNWEELLITLFSLISAIFLVSVYIFGWILSAILWVIGILFINILSINPASPQFIDAAVRPWQTLIGISNLLILSLFIFVGFGYILDLKNLKKDIRTFFLNVSVYALLLQFSLLGIAAVVNITNGIGDAMIYSYSGPVKRSDGTFGTEPDKSKLISGLIGGINSASIIRCGTFETGADGSSLNIKNNTTSRCKSGFDSGQAGGESDIFSSFGDFSSLVTNIIGPDFKNAVTNIGGGPDKSVSRSLISLIMESIFVVILFFAIFQMGRGLFLVMFRAVGLWMLMVLSPVALAISFLPFPNFSKYGQEFTDRLVKYTLFYPVFVLGLILIARLTEGFANSVKDQTVNSISNNAGAADGSNLQAVFGLFLGAMLIAIISVGALQVLFSFMEKTFGDLAKAVSSGAKNLFKGLTAAGFVTGAGARVLSKGVGAITGGSLKAIGSGLSNIGMKDAGNKFTKLGTGSEKWINKIGGEQIGGFFENIPLIAGGAVAALPAIGKSLYKNYEKRVAARSGAMKEGTLGMAEAALRSTGLAEVMKDTGIFDIDAEENMRRFQGMTSQDMIDAEKKTPGFIKNIRQDGISSVINSALGYDKTKPKFSVLQARADSFLERARQYGADSINMEQAELFINQMIDNPTIARRFFGSRYGQEIGQRVFNNLSTDTQRKIETEYLVALPTQLQEGAAKSLSLEEIKKLSPDMTDTANVQKGLKLNQVAVTNPDVIRDKLPTLYTTERIEDAQVALRNLIQQPEENSILSGAIDVGKQIVISQPKLIIQDDLIRNALASEFKTIDSDSSLSEAQKVVRKNEITKERLKDYSKREFGVEIDTDVDTTPQRIAQKFVVDLNDGAAVSRKIEELQNTSLGIAFTNNNDAWNSLDNDQDKLNALQNVIGSAAVAAFDGRQNDMVNNLIKTTEVRNGAVSVANIAAFPLGQLTKNLEKIMTSENPDFVRVLEDNNFQQSLGATAMSSKIKVFLQSGVSLDALGLPAQFASTLDEGTRAEIGKELAKAVSTYVQNGMGDDSEIQSVIATTNRLEGGGRGYTLDINDLRAKITELGRVEANQMRNSAQDDQDLARVFSEKLSETKQARNDEYGKTYKQAVNKAPIAVENIGGVFSGPAQPNIPNPPTRTSGYDPSTDPFMQAINADFPPTTSTP